MATLQPATYDPNAGIGQLANDSKEQRMTTWADFRSPAHVPADVDKLPIQTQKITPPPSYMTDSTTASTQQQEQDWTYDASRAAARNAFAKQKRISFGNAARQKAKRKSRHLAQTMRPAKPTIRVDTSISTHRGARPKQVYPREKTANIFGGPRPIPVPEEPRAPPKSKKWGFFGFGGRKDEPERAPTYELQESQQFQSSAPNANGFQGFRTKTLRNRPQPIQTRQQEPFVPPTPPPPPVPIVTRQAPDSPKELGPIRKTPTDISPSDQPITIGFSVSPEQAHEHDSSPVSSHGEFLDPSHITRQRSDTAASGDAPTIIVTPAYERTGWLNPNNRPRPPSSVYSRATNAYTVYHSNGEIPAVPAIPSSYAGQLQAQPLTERSLHANDAGPSPEKYPGLVDLSTTPQRKREKMASGTTVFEEDSNPATPKSVKGPTGLYIDTNIPPTPHRSRGWWNIITTPFDFTPRTPRFRFSTRSGSSRGNTTPDVPMIPAAAALGERSPPLPEHASTPTCAQSPVLNTSKEHVQAAKAPNSASTVFSPAMYSPASWEHSSANESPRTHDDLGISTGVGSHQTSGKSQPRPLSQSLQSETFSPDDRGTPATWGQGYGRERQPDPTQSQGTGNVYINHHYHYNGVPFYRDGGPPPRPARTETLRSTDTTPVLGVAALGAVLSARAVQKSNDPASTPRSMNATVEEEPSPKMLQAEQRTEQPRQAPVASSSTAPQATALYFPPPPNHASSHASEHSSRSVFQFTKNKAENPVLIKHEFEKAPKPPRVKGAGGYWSLWPWKKHKNPQDPKDPKDPAVKKKKKKRRCCCCCCLIFLILLIIMAALLGTLLPRSHHSSSSTSTGGSSSSSTSSDPSSSSTAPAPDIPSVWLNLTGFPPIPTGVATVARPDNFYSENGCTSPNTMWSCSVPKDEQDDIEPNDPDQPNFKFQIQFVNGTVSNVSSTIPLKTAIQKRRLLDMLRRSSEPEASPAAPSLEDQNFLGNTTDDNSQPFSGEETPFFITFYSGDHVSYRLAKRASSSSSSSSSSNGSIADIIPDPPTDSDGTAAAANLVFYPKNQPLRLYNRGRKDEHYGFYSYYDRSIFLKNTVAVNSSDTGELSADQDGGATKEAAKYRCTWAQTRFLVQIWTNSQTSKSLLVGSSTGTSTASAASASASSGTDFNQPGSFAYPVTISIDRHGGNVTEKMVYCWSLDDDGKYVKDSAKYQLEDRDFGGQAVNPSSGPYGNVTVSTEDGGPGGIDGGTGGCGCQWRNWDNA
ncbi:hypothetical protein IWZ01DRAFT_492542 [Phyllosticta capitalensis]